MSEWINVKDKLPAEGAEVLACNPNGAMVVATYGALAHYGYDAGFRTDDNEWSIDWFRWWMLLPALPVEVQS